MQATLHKVLCAAVDYALVRAAFGVPRHSSGYVVTSPWDCTARRALHHTAPHSPVLIGKCAWVFFRGTATSILVQSTLRRAARAQTVHRDLPRSLLPIRHEALGRHNALGAFEHECETGRHFRECHKTNMVYATCRFHYNPCHTS